MTVTMEPMVCGYLEGNAAGLMKGQKGRLRLPIPSYLIKHPKGNVIFDTGLHKELQTNPKRIGALADMFTIDFKPGDELGARLKSRGMEPERIDYMIVSHLHFDHVGGNVDLPNAKMIVQRREWDAGADPELVRRNGYNRADFDLGHPVQLVDGEYDLLGDGTVVCIPTYGHTAGHQSLRVRLENREVVLTADSCYMRKTIEQTILPPFAHSYDGMREVLDRFRAMERAGTRLIFGHDEAQWTAEGTLAEELS